MPARTAQVTNHSCRHSSGMGRQNTCYSVVGMTTNRQGTQEEASRHFELRSTWGCAQSIYVNARCASESKDSVANFPRRKTSGAAASIDIDAAVAAHHDEFAFPM